MIACTGWHSRGYLPHFDSAEVIQAVTFRLADSLPAHIVRFLMQDPRERLRLDEHLNAGRGACHLRLPAIADHLEQTLLHFDGDRYRLLAWCIMPNHVHVVVQTSPGYRLGDLVRSWKTFSAREANAILGLKGRFWCHDYFDRYVRGDTHLERTIAYTERNPLDAGLITKAEDWPWSSARFRRVEAKA
jgi:REP element-mobilizing transposase RayT